MRRSYEEWNPSPASARLIELAVRICEEYDAAGYDLTLRQLYYQFVARGEIENSQRSYKRLGSAVNKGRMAGLIDWDHIVDRTRTLRQVPWWHEPSDLISSAARSWHTDLWLHQPTRVEVWVEKEALAGVVEQVADRWQVPWFACRGYVSQSELWKAAQRIGRYIRSGQDVVILHLGDHDPSGIDMTRDVEDRLTGFISVDQMRDRIQPAGPWFEVERIALNMDQIDELNPPPNPAKLTDSRSSGYVAEFGHESWELDALDPATLDALIDAEIAEIADMGIWEECYETQEEDRATLQGLAERTWADVSNFANE